MVLSAVTFVGLAVAVPPPGATGEGALAPRQDDVAQPDRDDVAQSGQDVDTQADMADTAGDGEAQAEVETLPVEIVESDAEGDPAPARLPQQSNEAAPAPQQQAGRPATSEPQQPATAPAVDPAVSQGTIALGSSPDFPTGEDSFAPRPSTGDNAVSIQRGSGLNAPDTEVASLSVSSGAPARPVTGGGLPGAAPGSETAPETASASLPNMNADGSLNRRGVVTSIQPEAGQFASEDAPQADSTPPPPPPARLPVADPISEAVAPELAPRRVNAAEFTVPEGQPLMSVILIDDGADSIPIADAASVSLPVTIAVPAEASDAAERGAAFRAAGFEVLALLPEGELGDLAAMDDQGVIETVASVLAAVPDAVGLMDRADGVIVSDRRITEAALEYLALSGHVLVTQQRARGLNQVDRMASSMGVHGDSATRLLEETTDGGAISAILRRTSVDARTEGGAILVAPGDAAALTGLVTWRFSRAGRDVALAPITPLLDARASGG